MKLHERLRAGAGVVQTQPEAHLSAAYQEVKTRVHNQLIEELELSKLDGMDPDDLRAELRSIIVPMLSGPDMPINRIERERMTLELLDEVTGLGPLEQLLADPTVSDILINNHDTVYVERDGVLSRSQVGFRDDDHLLQIINRVVNRVGRRVDESSPMVDARLQDGSRVNAIIPPLALDGPVMSIRRFGVRALTAADLLVNGSVTEEMLEFLAAAAKAKLNIIISGGTGTGKTTFLNVLSSYIPPLERIVTIEDAAEIQLQQPHVVRLETRPPNVEGRGEIKARDLVRNSLRMRPDRIIIGECRAEEVMDMLQAMNTGHEGSMTTVHANSARDALHRIVGMAGLAGVTFSERLLNQTVARSVDLLIQLNRFPDGKRKVVSITEITGIEGDTITTQEIFVFEQRGTAAEGRSAGEYVATGIRPQCLERIRHAGGTFMVSPEP